MTTLDRSQAPPFQLSSDFSLAQPEIFSLGSGVNLFAFRQLQQDAVKLELIFTAGKWYEPALGISHFASQMLPKGTNGKNSFQIAEALDSLGAHLEISPGFDVSTLSLFALRNKLLAAVSILSEILERPAFNEMDLRQMKDIFIQGLRVNNQKTSVVASKKIRQVIFGDAHPYGSSVEEADVTRISVTAISEFYHRQFSLQSAMLVGRLTDAELKEVISLISTGRSRESEERRFERASGLSQAIAQPGSVQASLRLGKKCIVKGDNKEYFDAVMFNHILGGFFGSRLMKNIREEKGLTYGIHSSLHHFLHDSFWAISAEVNQLNAAAAIAEIKHEIIALQEQLVPEDELDVARNHFIGSWQSENSTMFAIAEKVKSIQLWGLPPDYYTHLLKHIQHITPLQIQAVAQSHFDTQDLLEIQVG
jgi:zinc protease